MKVLDARETARQLDTNGWIEIKGNPISKVGIFQYLGREIDQDGSMGLSPDKIYNVYRPAESLSDPETIESFKLLPWTDDHPSQLLGSPIDGRIPAENKGISGVIGQDVYFEYPYLRGNVKTFSEKMANKIKSGKIELSPGYLAKYILSKGNFEGQEYDVVQTHLRGNHLALVDEGRSGSDVRVLDHKVNDAQETVVKEEEKKAVDEGAEGAGATGLTLEGLRDQLAALSQIVNNFITQATDKKSMDEDPDKKDDDKKDDDKKPSMDAAAIRKSIYEEIANKNKLTEKLSQHVGSFDSTSMSLDEVARYGIEKLRIKCQPGQEQAVLDGYLAGAKIHTQPISSMDSYKKEPSQIDAFIKGGK